ncbi:MAG TPA: hypothetical protein VIR27_08020 [Mycobacteriales bacterium]
MSDDILWSGSEPTTTSPTRSGRRRVPPATLVGVGVALAVAAGAFYAGRVTAPAGPPTLAAAITQAQQGDLPCGQGNRVVTALCDTNGGFLAGSGGGTPGRGDRAGGNTGRGGGFGGRGGFGAGGLGGLFGPGAVTGTVATVHGDTLTLQTRAGTVDIALPTGVKVTTTTTGTATDVKQGATVVISSNTDANGNRVAQNIFVVPATGAN